MEEFPGNSREEQIKAKKAPKDVPPKVERIVEGKVKRRKKPLGRRFSEVFFGGDAREATSEVFLDVLVPAAQNMIIDAAVQGLERVIFGESRGRRTRTPISGRSIGSRFSYNKPVETQRPERSYSRRARSNHDFDEIVLETRAEGEDTIDLLFNLVSSYGQATVADLYNALGITSDYTDNDWGWRDLRGASVARVSDGYLLDLPKPSSLK